jgi:hypothetical protein
VKSGSDRPQLSDQICDGIRIIGSDGPVSDLLEFVHRVSHRNSQTCVHYHGTVIGSISNRNASIRRDLVMFLKKPKCLFFALTAGLDINNLQRTVFM